MNKHTPGPWTAYPVMHGAVDACFVDKWAIAEANPEYPNKPHGIPMTRANARLIAAAPDLLAALKQLLAYDNETEGGTFLSGDVVKARAAIAKAEDVS